MRIEIKKRDIIWNYIGTVFQMGVNFFMLPFLLYYLDTDTLGLWYLYMNLSNIAALFVFGFSPTFARNIAYCWSGSTRLDKFGATQKVTSSNTSENINWKLFNDVISTCRVIYLIVSIISLIVLGSAGSVYLLRVSGDMMFRIDIQLSWIILLASVFLNIYYGYYISALSGIGELTSRSKAQIYSNIVRIVLTAIFLHAKLGICGACLAYFIYGLMLRYLCKKSFFLSLKTSNFIKTKLEISDIFECFRVVWPNSWRDGMVSIADYLCTQVGTVVISFYIPLSEIAAYSLSVQLVTAIAKISRSYQIAQIPALQSAFITGDKERARNINSKCIVMFNAVFVMGILGVLFIACPIIEMIKREMRLNNLLLVLIGVSQYIIVMRNCYASYLSTTNRVNYWFSFIISGVTSVLLSILLLKNSVLGIYSVIVSSICSELVFNFWYWARVANDDLEIGIIDTYKVGVLGIKKDILNPILSHK